LTQGKIGNLLGGEVGLFHRLWDRQEWPFFLYLTHFWTLSGSTELGLTIVADGITTESRE
jgi:hypothetical protein